MNLIKSAARGLLPSNLVLLVSAITAAGAGPAAAENSTGISTIQIKADQITTKFSPQLYGLMTEEINFSYEGGIYGELIRNRTFKADARIPCSGR
jgi:alpha-N-arabinofuranosidase